MTWCHVRPYEGETFFGGGLQLYRNDFHPATLVPQEFPTDAACSGRRLPVWLPTDHP
jgi:hypothetical protein